MLEYHKIPTVFSRDPQTKYKTLLEGQFATPELEYLANNIWIFTEKIDGTNIRICWKAGGGTTIRGRTDNAQVPTFLFEKIQEILPASKFESVIDTAKTEELILCGEGYGAKIQKGGGNYRLDQGFILFDVRVGDWWLCREDVENIAAKLEINTVPIIEEGTLLDMVDMAKNGFESNWQGVAAEGIVARPKVELQARNGRRIITKIKHKDFLNVGT